MTWLFLRPIDTYDEMQVSSLDIATTMNRNNRRNIKLSRRYFLKFGEHNCGSAGRRAWAAGVTGQFARQKRT